MIEIHSTFTRHNGGTKFYEVVSLINTDTDSAVVIRRWGKVDAFRTGGGRCDCKSFVGRQHMLDFVSKVICDKNSRGFTIDAGDFGIHIRRSSEIEAESLEGVLQGHYVNKEVVKYAVQACSQGTSVSPTTTVSVSVSVGPEPERGSDWASW